MAVEKNGGIDGGAAGVVNAGRSAGDDHALGGRQFGGGSFAGAHLGVDAQFADLAGDQMAVLPARIEDDDLRIEVQVSMLASRRWSRIRPATNAQCAPAATPIVRPVRCTMTLCAVSSSACALGMASTAFPLRDRSRRPRGRSHPR